MNTKKLNSNEIITNFQMEKTKGGISLAAIITANSNTNLDGGDETDKRVKRPGINI